jgi:hypothetical protein
MKTPTWESRVEMFGKPEVNKKYLCQIQHDGSKNVYEMELILETEDEKTVDLDGDEIDYRNWSVISWIPSL